MIKYDITQSMADEAYETSKDIKVITKSMRGKEANFIGRLGEVVFQEWMHDNLICFKNITREYRHDYRLGVTAPCNIEVKTKDRTVVPKPDFECSITRYNIDREDADYYIFISMVREKCEMVPYTAYIVGFCNRAQLLKLGRVMPTGVAQANGTVFKEQPINLYNRQLIDPNIALQVLIKRHRLWEIEP